MFVYSAFDASDTIPRFHAEALFSAFSLRKVTDKPIRLVSNSPHIADQFSELAWNPFSTIGSLVDRFSHPKRQKLHAIATQTGPGFCYLDTDTVILADISRVFEMGELDIAGAAAPWREDIETIEIAVRREWKRAWQLNSGVLFFRRKNVGPLIDAWISDFESRLPEYAGQPDKIRDQVSFQKACVELKPDMFKLPNNYNFRTPMGGYLSGACFVLHGHLKLGLERLYNKFNQPDFLDERLKQLRVINHSMLGRVISSVYSNHEVTEKTFRRH